MMNLEKHEITHWLQKLFPSEEMSLADIQKNIEGMGLEEPLQGNVPFLYELAQIHSLAAFVLWNRHFQKRFQTWMKASLPGFVNESRVLAATSLLPLLSEASEVLFFHHGQAMIVSWDDAKKSFVAKSAAFREIPWVSLKAQQVSFSYSEASYRKFLREELIGIAALVAGLKKALYVKTLSYSKSRVQGGRIIQQWSEVQNSLSQLLKVVEREETLVNSLSLSTAFDILSEADRFASQAVQIFGGAGYIEDYKAEKYFRECVFLKNWLLPLREAQMEFFASEVVSHDSP